MKNLRPYLKTRVDDTKFLRLEFHDDNIYFLWNVQTKKFEAWYKPPSGPGYKVTTADNVSHATRIMRDMLRFEKQRAGDILKEIDEHNEKVVTDKEDDAMAEVRHDLKNILAGKQYFVMSNMQARRQNAYI